MKKFYLVLIIFSLFVFVSCGGSKNNSENPDEDGITDEDEYEVDADSTDTDDSTDTASDDDAADTGDTEPENAGVGIYLGILGFNEYLFQHEQYTEDIGLLDSKTVNRYKGFIDNLTASDGTGLYFADYTALGMMSEFQAPPKLKTVALVTFTDGLDNISLANDDYNPENYKSTLEYRDALHEMIVDEDGIHGHKVKAYTIGLRGDDVKDNALFEETLNKLASEPENPNEKYVFQVYDMQEAMEGFSEIARDLYSISRTVNLDVKVPGGYDDEQLLRFTFDNPSNAQYSNLYIEAKYLRSNGRTLDEVTYHGLAKGSKTIASSSSEGAYYYFNFKELQYADKVPVVSGSADAEKNSQAYSYGVITANDAQYVISNINAILEAIEKRSTQIPDAQFKTDKVKLADYFSSDPDYYDEYYELNQRAYDCGAIAYNQIQYYISNISSIVEACEYNQNIEDGGDGEYQIVPDPQFVTGKVRVTEGSEDYYKNQQALEADVISSSDAVYVITNIDEILAAVEARKTPIPAVEFQLVNGAPLSDTDINSIMLWKQNSSGNWDRESEFNPESSISVTEDKNSALIMLVLDCTTSLGDDFERMKQAGKDFVTTLVNGDSPALPECSILSGTPCNDTESGLTWSTRASDSMTLSEAEEYCDNYSESGISDWRLPNIDELMTLLISDKVSTLCQLSEENGCLSASDCWSCYTCSDSGTSCESDDTWGDFYADGRFSKFGESGIFWSYSPISSGSEYVWSVDFYYGAVKYDYMLENRNIRCVR